MKANQWREYFVFTKKERTGILILLVAIIVVAVLPFAFRPTYEPPDPEIMAAFKKDFERFEMSQTKDSSESKRFDVDHTTHSSVPEKLFPFNPNTIDREGWRLLGLPEKLITTIEKYKSKGGRFYKPEDLAKIYGLKKDMYEKLLPLVRMEKAVEQKNQQLTPEPAQTNREKKSELRKLDINLADTAAFVKLPAIGSKLAARIILFREKLGGFYSVQQLAEVYGISDSAFTVIQPYLFLGAIELTKINVNTADFEVLRSHPYIKGQLASAIIQYRKQHQSFKSLEALKQIHLLTDDVYIKLAPYLEL